MNTIMFSIKPDLYTAYDEFKKYMVFRLGFFCKKCNLARLFSGIAIILLLI